MYDRLITKRSKSTHVIYLQAPDPPILLRAGDLASERKLAIYNRLTNIHASRGSGRGLRMPPACQPGALTPLKRGHVEELAGPGGGSVWGADIRAVRPLGHKSRQVT